MSKIIGIDFGTTNSCIAVYEGNEVCVISNSAGERSTPSVVAHTKMGKRLIGFAAMRQAVTNCDRTVLSIKRWMGTDYRVQIDEEKYTPQVISAMILARLKKDAEDYLGETVKGAVISVPASFSSLQRQAILDAAEISGFEVPRLSHRIINDSTAAAFVYGFNRDDLQRILVFDLGGGALEVSIVECEDKIIETLAVSGSDSLGGDDFDQCIVDYLVYEFRQATGIDLLNDHSAMCRVREAAENAKNELSYVNTTVINIPFLSADCTGPKHMELMLTRSKFEELTRHLVDKILVQVQQAVADSGRDISELDQLLMIGGASRIPAVRNAVCGFIGKDPFKGINPDECVAIGAALQGAVLNGELRNSLVLEALPASLGVETTGNVFTAIVNRNTTIPHLRKQVFSTNEDFQKSIAINVLQGESEAASENKWLGTFQLEGIQIAARGIPRIEVTFSIDANGIVEVSAKDQATGEQKAVTITNSNGMSKYEINRAKRDVAAYASEADG